MLLTIYCVYANMYDATIRYREHSVRRVHSRYRLEKVVSNDTSTMSTTRQAIAERLATRTWYQNTDQELQQTLLNLPENWNGFLDDLAARPETISNVTQLRLLNLLHANFGTLVVFEVKNAKGDVFTYEYHSWRHGPNSGSKGVVFVRTGDVITDFVVLRGEKFGPAKPCWDTTGGFAEAGFTLSEQYVNEIRQELGSSDIEVNEVHDLGNIMTDAGQTNNNPSTFVAIIDAHNATKVERKPINPDVYELQAGAFVFPISQLPAHILENGDTFFLTAVLRSVAMGILPASAITPQT